jgi:serpin B
MQRPILVLLVAALLVGAATGCRVVSPPVAAASERPRVANPQVDAATLETLVAGNTAFALDLYRALREGGAGGAADNLFYSPLSISLALAMTYAGAAGETAEQMAATLHYDLPQADLHRAFNYLDHLLKSRGQGAQGKDGKGFRLNVVNAIWGQRNYHFEGKYLDTLAENYGAGIRLLDYVAEPERSRQTINKWVSDQTEARIKDLIPAGAIDALTRLVLTNAVYFNAAWASKFEKGATKDGAFYLADGTQVTKPLMTASERLGYASGDGYQVVQLPYDRDELAMTIIVPDSGRFAEVEGAMSAEWLTGALARVADEQLLLTMPKFGFESSFSLGDLLAAMGMPVAFSDGADFSGMTGKRDLQISEVVHKAFVAVDEEGTEAAAATGVIMRTTAMPAEPREVRIDRPFIFMIRDLETETVLFVGRVVR